MRKIVIWFLSLSLVACGVNSPTTTAPTAAPSQPTQAPVTAVPAPTTPPTQAPTAPAAPTVEPSPNLPPTVPPQPSPDNSTANNPAEKKMLDLAKAALAKELNIGVDQISVTAIEAVEWSDGSLGCPKPGQAYLQIIIPGFRMLLEAQGKSYNFHSDMEQTIVKCER